MSCANHPTSNHPTCRNCVDDRANMAATSSSGVEHLIPPSPTIEALRAALADFDDVNTGHVGDYTGLGYVIDAARAVVREFDDYTSYVKRMLEIPRPTAAEIHRQFVELAGLPTPTLDTLDT